MNQIKVMGIRKTHKWHAAMCKIQGQVKIALNMLNQLYADVVEWQTRYLEGVVIYDRTGSSPVIRTIYADMVELADTLDSKSSSKECGFKSHYRYQL